MISELSFKHEHVGCDREIRPVIFKIKILSLDLLITFCIKGKSKNCSQLKNTSSEMGNLSCIEMTNRSTMLNKKQRLTSLTKIAISTIYPRSQITALVVTSKKKSAENEFLADF